MWPDENGQREGGGGLIRLLSVLRARWEGAVFLVAGPEGGEQRFCSCSVCPACVRAGCGMASSTVLGGLVCAYPDMDVCREAAGRSRVS